MYVTNSGVYTNIIFSRSSKRCNLGLELCVYTSQNRVSSEFYKSGETFPSTHRRMFCYIVFPDRLRRQNTMFAATLPMYTNTYVRGIARNSNLI